MFLMQVDVINPILPPEECQGFVGNIGTVGVA